MFIIMRLIIYLNLVSNIIHMKNTEMSGLNWKEQFKIEGLKDNDIQQHQSNECPQEFSNFCMKKQHVINDRYRLFSENRESKIKRIFNEDTGDWLGNICQCKLGFGYKDLGNNFYPRYISTGFCRRDSCNANRRCHPKKYKLRVLKRKIMDFDGLEPEDESILPESLQNDWTDHFENIIVGCDCLPKKLLNNI